MKNPIIKGSVYSLTMEGLLFVDKTEKGIRLTYESGVSVDILITDPADQEKQYQDITGLWIMFKSPLKLWHAFCTIVFMTDPKLKGKAKRKEKTLLRAEKRSAVGTPTVKKTYKKLIKSKIKSL